MKIWTIVARAPVFGILRPSLLKRHPPGSFSLHCILLRLQSVRRNCRARTDHSSRPKPTTKYSWGRKSSKMDKTSASASASSQHVGSDELYRGKWIGLSEITYKDPNGKDRKWEGVFRTTKIGDGSDAVVIIPVLKKKDQPDCVILVNQYRPPMKGYSLEFPAGLIDKGEDPKECALRELKEETGYTGVPTQISPGVSLDPGLANSTVSMVTVEIDGDNKCNRKPEQQQDEGEFIEVMSVPVDDLLNTLNNYSKDGGVVHSILYTYAMAVTQFVKPKKDVP